MKKAFALFLAACCIFTGISFALPIVANEAEAGDAALAQIEIATAEDFLKIGNDANFPLDGSYLLKNDIAVTSEAYVPVGTYAAPFTGSFDGNGKTVTLNVTYTNDKAKATVADCAYVGLFGVVKTATVRNLKVAGSMKANTVCGCMGTVIGATNGSCTVENIVSTVEAIFDTTGDHNGMSFVGGIIGKVDGDGTVNNSSTTVKGCTFSGSVKEIAKAEKASDAKAIEYRISGSGAAGGIVGATGWSVPKGGWGYAAVTIEACVFDGKLHVTQGNQNIGGFLGMTPAYGKLAANGTAIVTIKNSANYGAISRDHYVSDRMAAFAGYIWGGNVTECIYDGSLKEGTLISDNSKTKMCPLVGWYNANGKGYMQNCISLVAVDQVLEKLANMTKDKCTNNYVPSDTKDKSTTGFTKLTTASTQKEQLVKEVMVKTANVEGMKDLFVAAGIGDLVSLYFDYNKPTGATTLGYQVTDVKDGAYNIRFVSLIDSLEYGKIGYDIVATYEGGSKEFSVDCKTVYTALTASVDATDAAYTVTSGYYIMALAITDIPASVGTVHFTVTPYTVTDGVKTSGITAAFDYTPTSAQSN